MKPSTRHTHHACLPAHSHSHSHMQDVHRIGSPNSPNSEPEFRNSKVIIFIKEKWARFPWTLIWLEIISKNLCFLLQPQVNNLTLIILLDSCQDCGVRRPKVRPEPSPSQLELGTQGTYRNGGHRRHLRPDHSRKFGPFPRLRSTSTKLAAFFGFWGHTFQGAV